MSSCRFLDSGTYHYRWMWTCKMNGQGKKQARTQTQLFTERPAPPLVAFIHMASYLCVVIGGSSEVCAVLQNRALYYKCLHSGREMHDRYRAWRCDATRVASRSIRVLCWGRGGCEQLCDWLHCHRSERWLKPGWSSSVRCLYASR